MNNKWFLPAGLVIAGFVLFFLFQKYKVAPEINFQSLSLSDMAGQPVNFDDFKGKKLVVCFGASWCGPCRQELKDIGEVKSSLLGDVEVLIISDEPIEKIKEFSQMTSASLLF